jgi:Rod binding domain-containing protein
MSDLLKGISMQSGQATASLDRVKLDELQKRFGSQVTVRKIENVQQALEQMPSAQRKEAEDAANQFEGLLLQQLFKSMWQTVPKGGMLSSSHEESLYRDMLNEALTENVTDQSSIGVRDVVLRELVGRYNQSESIEEGE